jgi:protein phosphatase
MVADGMGGHACGERASRAALEFLVSDPSFWENESSCSQALSAANDRMYDLMGQIPGARGMGTTIVGVAIGPKSLIHFNVGDSRIYRHKLGNLVKLSRDDVPMPGRDGARRTSHLITQALGGQIIPSPILPHVATDRPLEHSETLLICTDGLTDMIGEDDVLSVLDRVRNVQVCAQKLLEMSLGAGGDDNVSIVVVRALIRP